MMAFPYSGEDMECAAVARASMVAQNTTNNNNNNNNTGGNSHAQNSRGTSQLQPEDSLMGIYSTSESEAEFSNPPSVSTTMLVGTFYDPNTPSETNSFVSSLQDELSNNGHPREQGGGGDQPQQPCVTNLHVGGSPTSVISFPQFYRNSKGNTSNPNFDSYARDSFSTLGVPWKGGDLSAGVAQEQALSGGGYTRRRMCFGLATCLLVVVAVAMGVIIGVNHEQSKTDSAPLRDVQLCFHTLLSRAHRFSLLLFFADGRIR